MGGRADTARDVSARRESTAYYRMMSMKIGDCFDVYRRRFAISIFSALAIFSSVERFRSCRAVSRRARKTAGDPASSASSSCVNARRSRYFLHARGHALNACHCYSEVTGEFRLTEAQIGLTLKGSPRAPDRVLAEVLALVNDRYLRKSSPGVSGAAPGQFLILREWRECDRCTRREQNGNIAAVKTTTSMLLRIAHGFPRNIWSNPAKWPKRITICGAARTNPPFGTTVPREIPRSALQRHDVATCRETERTDAEAHERRDDDVDERAAERVKLDQAHRLVGERRVGREGAHHTRRENSRAGSGRTAAARISAIDTVRPRRARLWCRILFEAARVIPARHALDAFALGRDALTLGAGEDPLGL
jgi:hypothetical protein